MYLFLRFYFFTGVLLRQASAFIFGTVRSIEQIELGQLHVLGDGDRGSLFVPPVDDVGRGVANWMDFR